MAHDFTISDEQYAKLAVYAAQRNQTPETLFQEWIRTVTENLEQSLHPTDVSEQPGDKEEDAISEEEIALDPLFEVEGMFAIGELGWADRHDQHLAETYLEQHADSE